MPQAPYILFPTLSKASNTTLTALAKGELAETDCPYMAALKDAFNHCDSADRNNKTAMDGFLAGLKKTAHNTSLPADKDTEISNYLNKRQKNANARRRIEKIGNTPFTGFLLLAIPFYCGKNEQGFEKALRLLHSKDSYANTSLDEKKAELSLKKQEEAAPHKENKDTAAFLTAGSAVAISVGLLLTGAIVSTGGIAAIGLLCAATAGFAYSSYKDEKKRKSAAEEFEKTPATEGAIHQEYKRYAEKEAARLAGAKKPAPAVKPPTHGFGVA